MMNRQPKTPVDIGVSVLVGHTDQLRMNDNNHDC